MKKHFGRKKKKKKQNNSTASLNNMLKLDGLREFSKGLSTAASKALMKSTPLRSLGRDFYIWLQKSSLKPWKETYE